MRQRARKGEGVVAARFRSMLESELGSRWEILSLCPVAGHWLKEDVYRVEGMLLSPSGFHIALGAWETMTSIVRSGGVCLTFDTWCVEVWSKDNTPSDYNLDWRDRL